MRKRRKLGRGERREGETRGDEGPSQTTISGREKKNPRFLEGYLNCRESGHCVPSENRSGPAVVYKRPCITDVTVQPPLFQGSIPSPTKYGFIVSRHGLDISQWEQAVPPAPATQNLGKPTWGDFKYTSRDGQQLPWHTFSFKSVCWQIQSHFIFAQNLPLKSTNMYIYTHYMYIYT